MNLGLMPAYLLREWTADGKPLSGGTLSFYQSGTFTPKAVYADAEGTISLGNTVTLDASGSAVIFLARGAYRIWLKNAQGSQIVPYVDGIVGSGFGVDSQSNITFAMVKNYDDLRQLTGEIDVVYVAGRLTEGDGGAGLFQYTPADISTDNDGTILVTALQNKVFKRVFDGYLDPLWWGVVYGNTDSFAQFNLATAASAALNFPLLITGSIQVSQNVTIPDGANLEFTDGAFMLSGSGLLTMTFSSGSHLKATSRIFGTNIYPKIAKGVVDKLPISWMAGQVDDDRVTKLFGASTDANQVLSIDESISVASGTWECPNRLIFEYNSVIELTGTSDLSWTNKNIEVQPIRMFNVTEATTIFFDFGPNYPYVEMFGAVGDSTTSDSRAFDLALGNGKFQLVEGKVYSLPTQMTMNTSTKIKGNTGVMVIGTNNMNCSTLDIEDLIIQYTGTGNWFTGTDFSANNSSFKRAISVSGTTAINNCAYDGDTRLPTYEGKPALYNPHLPLLPSTQGLATDGDGKIIQITNGFYLEQDTDFTFTLGNWPGMQDGICFCDIWISPITKNMAYIQLLVTMKTDIRPPVDSDATRNFAYFDIVPTSDLAKYWLSDNLAQYPHFFGQMYECSQFIKAYIQDTHSYYYPVAQVPMACQSRDTGGGTPTNHVFCFMGNTGMGADGTATPWNPCPNPMLSWRQIFGDNLSTGELAHLTRRVGATGILQI